MSIKSKIYFYFIFVFIILTLLGGYVVFVAYKINKHLTSELPQAVMEVQKKSRLDALAQLIRYDDEVLTQSARNYAFTGEEKWRLRYEEFIPKLDGQIKEALLGGDFEDKKIFEDIDKANLDLVVMEEKALALTAENNLSEAQALLDSQEYAKQKEIYQAGLEKYANRQGVDFQLANSVSIKELEASRKTLDKLIVGGIRLALLFIIFFVLNLLFLFYFILRTFMQPLGLFKIAAREVIDGNLKARVLVKNKDEIGDFAVDFNQMIFSLKQALENVNLEVAKQTKDLKQKSLELVKQQQAILNVLEDVEEEKNKAETLASIINDADQAIVGKDLNGKISSWNKGAEKLYGYVEEEMIGHPVEILVPKEKRKEFLEILKNIKNGKNVDHMQTIRKRKNGVLVDVSLTVSPIKNKNGQIIGASSMAIDISKEKQIDKAKTEFVSLASHQLRTPLSAINWYTEMLLAGDAGPINSEQKQYLEEVYKGNQRMVDLVNALLNVSRLELGTFMVEPEEINIIDLANDIIKEIKPQIEAKKIDFNFVFDQEVGLLMLDKKLMAIVFQNLLSNAVKYTPAGGRVNLDISKDKDKKNILITVEDTGIGIPQDQREKIFDKLFRADNVRSTDTEGTGLGLYIVREIMNNVDGKIWFESEENKGSKFYAQIPLVGMKKKTGSKNLA